MKTRTIWPALTLAVVLTSGCGSGTDTVDATDDATVNDTLSDVAGEDVFETTDTQIRDLAETNDETDADSTDVADTTQQKDATDIGPRGLPDTLNIDFTRPDEGEPVSQAEIDEFTRRLMRFLRDVHYVDYVLYTTYGVDASTGMRDFHFWYSERMKKEGDLVTFYHPERIDGGGHNLHTPMSKVTSNLIAAWLLYKDETSALAVEKLCKGLSASMLGMMHDEDDLPHLMTRNVVMMSQDFYTHDGKHKAVDPSGWYSEYQRWNTERYHITDNPYWGEVWVTNLRSKDDVPYIFQLVPSLRYLVDEAPEGELQNACFETLNLLEAFAKDIVDHDYHIRTRDADGNVFEPGYTGDPELDQEYGDISSFTFWSDLIPEGECNARRAARLVAYHEGDEESCGRGEPNTYDDIAFINNGYNKRICQFFHLAHLANALVSNDNESALQLLDGMRERIEEDLAMAGTQEHYSEKDFTRNMAMLISYASVFGYPLTSNDVRLLHAHHGLAVEKYLEWPYWDPWDESVPDGDLGAYRPYYNGGSGETEQCWTRVEDISVVWNYCWSPLRNMAGRQWVNCDIVRNPESWDENQ